MPSPLLACPGGRAIILQRYLFALLLCHTHTEQLFVCVCFFSLALSLLLARDNYAPLSIHCQAQFATQIKCPPFEEQRGQGEGEKQDGNREKAKCKITTKG